MIRFSTKKAAKKKDATPLDFFSLLSKRDKRAINTQSGAYTEESSEQGSQKSRTWDPESPGPIFAEVEPLAAIRNFSEKDEWELEVCENRPIVFSDKDLPAGGTSHNDALYIVVEARGTNITHVLIDGGAGLNLCPQETARWLDIRDNEYSPSSIFIHGYDGTGQRSLGCICLDLNISGTLHRVLFHVVDIEPSFNLLLGRPWIHATNAVPSTLHQCVKWAHNQELITIYAEDRRSRYAHPMIPVPTYTVEVPSVQVCKEEEIVQDFNRLTIGKHKKQIWVKKGEASYKNHPLYQKFSQHQKGLDLLIRHGYTPFTGLGKNEDGILEPVTVKGQRGTQALGCQHYYKVEAEGEFKPVPFVKADTIGGCSSSSST